MAKINAMSMPRRVRAIFLLVAMIWQTMGMLGSYSVGQRAGEFEHQTVHVQEVDHHHADYSLHIDVDEGTAQHFHADTGSGGNVLLTSAAPHQFGTRAMNLPVFSAALWLSPTLEGPLRPPQHIA